MAPLQIEVMLIEVQLAHIACIDLLGKHEHRPLHSALGDFASPDLALHAVDMTFLLYLERPVADQHDRRPWGPARPWRTTTCPRGMRNVLTTCTGVMWLTRSVVLDGMGATTNGIFLGIARDLYLKVEWLDPRWVVGGKFWTRGVAFAGMGMMATYIKEKFHEGMALTSCELLDVDPTARGQFY